MFSVEGKTAIVTGAGSGINYCFTALLLSKGCNVVLADLKLRPEAQKLIDTYTNSPRAIFVETDVTQWVQLERMFAVARSTFPSIDIVCPGAGIFEPDYSNFWHPPGSSAASKDAPDGNRYASIDVNVTHPIRTTQLAISEFLNPKDPATRASAENEKRILIVSSIAGQISNLVVPTYIAAKHAMNGFVRSLASLSSTFHIRVNGVAPGVIKTPIWTEQPEKLALVDAEKDEWATPEEVAEAMLKLLVGGEEEVGGGTIMEVGKGQTRMVEAFGDMGPGGKGHTVSGMGKGYENVYGLLGEEGWGQKAEVRD